MSISGVRAVSRSDVNRTATNLRAPSSAESREVMRSTTHGPVPSTTQASVSTVANTLSLRIPATRRALCSQLASTAVAGVRIGGPTAECQQPSSAVSRVPSRLQSTRSGEATAGAPKGYRPRRRAARAGANSTERKDWGSLLRLCERTQDCVNQVGITDL